MVNVCHTSCEAFRLYNFKHFSGTVFDPCVEYGKIRKWKCDTMIPGIILSEFGEMVELTAALLHYINGLFTTWKIGKPSVFPVFIGADEKPSSCLYIECS